MLRFLKKKYWKYIAIFLLSITSISLLAVFLPKLSFSFSPPPQPKLEKTLAVKIDPEIPQSVIPCLPDDVKEIKLEANANNQTTQYYLLGAYAVEAAPHDFEYWSPLVAVSKGDCKVLNGQSGDKHKSLGKFVNQDISRELALIQLKGVIDEKGIEVFKKNLLTAQGSTYLSTDYAWAYEQLGIEIPENVTVVDSFPTAHDLGLSETDIFHSD